MPKFCPECGLKLEKEFKFCPECGVSFRNLNQQNSPNDKISDVVVCNNCGEENSPENFICAGCGIKLKDKAEDKQVKSTAQPVEKKKQHSHQKKASKQSGVPDKKQQQPLSKTLNRKELFIITGILLVAIVLILSFSGVLDAKKVTETDLGNVNQVQSSGVNLNNIQKINELEARVKANPNDKESILALAHLKNDSGLYEQAIVNYKQYLKIQPEDADARVDMGVCYYNLGDFKTAISEMETALKYKPNHQIAFLNLGIVNLSAGDLEKSKEWLNKAVKQNPDNDVGKRAKELLESHAK
jgi:tetratricopeptide (TPR) repeat protein